MAFELREKDFESFFEVPFRVYGKSSPFVSLMKSDMARFLDEKQNPLLAKYGRGSYFSLLENGKPVGRILAHIHEASNSKFALKRGYFGYFDCDHRPEVGKLLLTRAEAWHREQGMEEIAGNFNMTAMQQIGVVTEGFGNAPYTDQVYSPPHIAEHLQTNGYSHFFPSTTFELDLRDFDEASLLKERHRELLDGGEFTYENIHLFNTKACLRGVHETLNDGFRDNPQFVPVSWEEFEFQAKDMMWVMDRKISVLMKRGSEPVGSLVCIPDLNPFLQATQSRLQWNTPYQFLKHRLNRKRAVIIFYSVKRSYHGLGLNALMLHRMVTNLKARGYERLGFTWIADENPASLRQMEKLGARRLHRLGLFKKEL